MNRYTNAFILGAQSAKPSIQVMIVYVGDYIAPAETRDGIKSMAQQGADVIFSELDDNSSILECAANNIYCIAQYLDKHSTDPKTVLTSVVQEWAVQLKGPIEAVQNGTWAEFRNNNYFQPQNLAADSVHLGEWSTTASEDVKKAVAVVEANIKSGVVKVPMDESKPLSGKKLTVTAILYGHANEGTWDTTIMDGFKAAQAKVNFDLNLNEATATEDSSKAMTDWAGKGVDLILAHSNSYTDHAIEVAKQFPKVHFIAEAYIDPDSIVGDSQQDKYKQANTPTNLVIAGVTPEPGNYLAGYAAAMMSKSGMVGVLQPFEAAPLNRQSNAFIFGAQAAKPDIKFRVVYMGNYVAPDVTRDAVKSLSQQGADVIFSEMDDNSSILECAANGIYCITTWSDKHSFDPKTVLVSVVSDFSVALTGALTAIQQGSWDAYRASNYFTPQSLANGGTKLGVWGDTVPDNVKTAVAGIEAKFKDGSLKVEWSTEKLVQ
jgi:basic membrane protein A